MDFIYDIYINLYLILRFICESFVTVFGLRVRYECKSRIDGKVVVITGGNTGIGKETALQLAINGAKVIIGCRDLEKAENAIKDITGKHSMADIIALRLDLCSLSSVRHFAESVAEMVTKVDILINNAGVFGCPERRTEDGFELMFGTNHLGHFLLTLSLLKLLKKSPKAKIITVSSLMHTNGKIHFENINLRNGSYHHLKAYSQSKLANVLFTRELTKRLGPNSNINTYCLHPGIICSDLFRSVIESSYFYAIFYNIIKIFYINNEFGAKTTLYCALEVSLENESGFYYEDCQKIMATNMVRAVRDNDSANKLWEMSCELVNLENELRIN